MSISTGAIVVSSYDSLPWQIRFVASFGYRKSNAATVRIPLHQGKTTQSCECADSQDPLFSQRLRHPINTQSGRNFAAALFTSDMLDCGLRRLLKATPCR